MAVNFSQTPAPKANPFVKPSINFPLFGNSNKKFTAQTPEDTFELISKLQKQAKKDLNDINKRRNTDELLTRAMYDLLIALNYINQLPTNKHSKTLKEMIGSNTEKALQTIALTKEVASRDSLTGLRDESSYESTLDTAIKKANKSGTPFVIAMADIDYFKDVNDNSALGTKQEGGETKKGYGSHGTGDIALKAVAHTLQEALGDNGEAFRLHGEEFTLFIPDKTMAKAKEILQNVSDSVFNLRTNTEQFKRNEDEPLLEVFKHRPIALSIGAMEVTKNTIKQIDPTLKSKSTHTAETIKALKGLEDSAMYSAKQNGRNRIHTIQFKTGTDGKTKAKTESLYIGEEFKYKAGTVMSNNG